MPYTGSPELFSASWHRRADSPKPEAVCSAPATMIGKVAVARGEGRGAMRLAARNNRLRRSPRGRRCQMWRWIVDNNRCVPFARYVIYRSSETAIPRQRGSFDTLGISFEMLCKLECIERMDEQGSISSFNVTVSPGPTNDSDVLPEHSISTRFVTGKNYENQPQSRS